MIKRAENDEDDSSNNVSTPADMGKLVDDIKSHLNSKLEEVRVVESSISKGMLSMLIIMFRKNNTRSAKEPQ